MQPLPVLNATTWFKPRTKPFPLLGLIVGGHGAPGWRDFRHCPIFQDSGFRNCGDFLSGSGSGCAMGLVRIQDQDSRGSFQFLDLGCARFRLKSDSLAGFSSRCVSLCRCAVAQCHSAVQSQSAVQRFCERRARTNATSTRRVSVLPLAGTMSMICLYSERGTPRDLASHLHSESGGRRYPPSVTTRNQILRQSIISRNLRHVRH